MSENSDKDALSDAAILTKAVSNLMRKLIRLLMGRMTLTKLQQMIRVIFVEEAEIKLTKNKPDSKISMTKLALLTGLDTRTLHKAINEIRKSKPLHKEGRFLKEITPESSILDYWSSNSKYQDKRSNKPLVLKLKGDRISFDSLVKETTTSRGVTTSSLLTKLVQSKSVEFDEVTQTVKLLTRQYLYFENKNVIIALETGLAAVSNLLETLVHNFKHGGKADESFFERSNWTHRLSIKDVSKLRNDIRNQLTVVERDIVKTLMRYEEDKIGEDQVTAGVGLFYFEEKPED